MAVVPMVMTAAHLHFLHHFLVCLWGAPYECVVFIYCELRHFAQERHDIPKQFIIVRDAPGRHARHLDPMFHHPKLFCGREPSTAPELRGSWIEAPTDLRSVHTGSKMAGDAHLLVLHSTGGDTLGVTQIDRNSISGVSCD